MQTVLLYSKVGPHHIRRRVMDDNSYRVEEYDWSIDNGLKARLPMDYWESLSDQFLDKSLNLRYREAFIPL